MRLQIALSEDRQRWQKKAQQMTIRDGYIKNKSKMKQGYNPKHPPALTDPMQVAVTITGTITITVTLVPTPTLTLFQAATSVYGRASYTASAGVPTKL